MMLLMTIGWETRLLSLPWISCPLSQILWSRSSSMFDNTCNKLAFILWPFRLRLRVLGCLKPTAPAPTVYQELTVGSGWRSIEISLLVLVSQLSFLLPILFHSVISRQLASMDWRLLLVRKRQWELEFHSRPYTIHNSIHYQWEKHT